MALLSNFTPIYGFYAGCFGQRRGLLPSYDILVTNVLICSLQINRNTKQNTSSKHIINIIKRRRKKMNNIRTNPFLIGVINAVLTFAGSCGMIYILSLIDKVPFLTKVKDPVMMIILIAFPIICGVSAFIKARKERQASC